MGRNKREAEKMGQNFFHNGFLHCAAEAVIKAMIKIMHAILESQRMV